MKKTGLILILLFVSVSMMFARGGYKVGDKAADFNLKNVNNKMVSMSDYPNAKGFVVIFTCNHCPFAKAYQDRIIAIDKTYRPKGYPVIAINPNDPTLVPEDSFAEMQKRAKEKNYPFPYLIDAKQEVYKEYGATNTPHAFLLKREGKDLVVKYIGTIDNNYQDASKVTKHYLTDAIDALLAGKDPNPDYTKAIGCSIKSK